VFERYSSSQNLELQQRSCEYLGLPDMGIDVMEEVRPKQKVWRSPWYIIKNKTKNKTRKIIARKKSTQA